MQIGDIIQNRIASIDSDVGNTSKTSIELPSEIAELITGDEFWVKAKTNRYKWLIREGYLQHLLELARFCRETATENASYMFAKFASKAKWEQTLTLLEKMREVAKTAAEVVKRLTPRPEQLRAVYKACWQFGAAVIPKAILAQEIVGEKGGSTVKLFNWLCYKT